MHREPRQVDRDASPRVVIDAALEELGAVLGPIVDTRMRRVGGWCTERWAKTIADGYYVKKKEKQDIEVPIALEDPSFTINQVLKCEEYFNEIFGRPPLNEKWKIVLRNVRVHRNRVAHYRNDITDQDVDNALRHVERILRALGEDALAKHMVDLRGPATQRIKRRINAARPPISPPMRRLPADVLSVGVHWEQPRESVPAVWWVVTLQGSSLARCAAEQSLDDVGRYLVGLRRRGHALVAGLAFCFSAPAWFIDDECDGTYRTFWERCSSVVVQSEEDLVPAARALGEPFYVPPVGEAAYVDDPTLALRRTEQTVLAETTAEPSSIFELGSPGSVGVLAIKGVELLQYLDHQGFAIWPFSPPDLSGATCVEIFPRALWAAIRPDEALHSTPRSRERFLREPEVQQLVKSGERAEHLLSDRRAFDAFVTAWALRNFGAELPERMLDGPAQKEGEIWLPAP